MNDSKIIFLGGIHGAGKGTISKKIIAETNLEYLLASELLKWKEVSKDVENKTVSNITNTQVRLLNALKQKCKLNKKYLLDGHYCLLNEESKPTKIDIEVFRTINPQALLVITEKPEIIKQRLEKRDNKQYELRLISKLQKTEVTYAKEIARNLNVPFLEVKGQEIMQSIHKIIKMI